MYDLICHRAEFIRPRLIGPCVICHRTVFDQTAFDQTYLTCHRAVSDQTFARDVAVLQAAKLISRSSDLHVSSCISVYESGRRASEAFVLLLALQKEPARCSTCASDVRA